MSLNFLSKSPLKEQFKWLCNPQAIHPDYNWWLFSFKREKQLKLVTEMTHHSQFSARLFNAAIISVTNFSCFCRLKEKSHQL